MADPIKGEMNPNHPVTIASRDLWHKIVALLIMKYGGKQLRISPAEVDRFRGFQKGPYACRENALVLTHLEEALMWMQQRTIARIKRGVEGTHEK